QNPVCDSNDSANDGVYVFPRPLPAGEYLVIGTESPRFLDVVTTIAIDGLSETHRQVVTMEASVVVTFQDSESLGFNGTGFRLTLSNGITSTRGNLDSDGDYEFRFYGLEAGSYGLFSIDQHEGFPRNFYAEDIPDMQVDASQTLLVSVDYGPRVPSESEVVLKVIVRTSAGDAVTNACFLLAWESGLSEQCDLDDGAFDGTVRFYGEPAQTEVITLTQTRVPFGHHPPASIVIADGVTVGSQGVYAVTNEPYEVSAVVRIFDGNGQPFKSGGCFDLPGYVSPPQVDGPTSLACVRTDNSPLSGTARFFALAPGTYTVNPQPLPTSSGWQMPLDPLTLEISEAGPTPELSVYLLPIDQSTVADVRVDSTDEFGGPALGACFTLVEFIQSSPNGPRYYYGCDSYGAEGFNDPLVDGVTWLIGIPDGVYTLIENRAPTGFELAESRQITVSGERPAEIFIEHQQLPATPTPTPSSTNTPLPTATPLPNTPAGENVQVTSGGDVAAGLTFDEVVETGDTTVAVVEEPNVPPVPETFFSLGGLYFDATTTALFNGNVIICFPYDTESFSHPELLALLHHDGTEWVDVTTSNDTVLGSICGSVSSLSPFAIVEPTMSLNGFYPPVDMPIGGIIWNTVNAGSTVPLKFEVFAGGLELADLSSITEMSFQTVSCAIDAPENGIEQLVSGESSLSYSGGQFRQNWKTPDAPGTCYKVTVSTVQGSGISAYFKLE
ncbi:MAG: PxKF domain-containing protein, partial [Thermomicrobiales bacterium]